MAMLRCVSWNFYQWTCGKDFHWINDGKSTYSSRATCPPPSEIASLMIRAYNHWFPFIRPAIKPFFPKGDVRAGVGWPAVNKSLESRHGAYPLEIWFRNNLWALGYVPANAPPEIKMEPNFFLFFRSMFFPFPPRVLFRFHLSIPGVLCWKKQISRVRPNFSLFRSPTLIRIPHSEDVCRPHRQIIKSDDPPATLQAAQRGHAAFVCSELAATVFGQAAVFSKGRAAPKPIVQEIFFELKLPATKGWKSSFLLG